ncbi:hypothetical protein ACW73L_16060 [Methylolobus aquaticus]
MTNRLRKSIATLLTGSALAVASGSASALQVTADLGTLGAAGLFRTDTVPQYAWDGWNGIVPNLGWVHNSKWYTFRVSTQSSVQITMTSSDVGMKPAFTVWQTTGSFIGSNHLSHQYNQVSFGGDSAFLQPQPPGTDGTRAFMGYVNGGNNFTNGNGNSVGAGTSNMSRRATGYAAFARTLPAGQYLLAVGGSCNNQTCGTPGAKNFKLNVQRLPLANSGISP